MNIGVSGIGSMEIAQGGLVSNTGAARLATTASGEGHVDVAGDNSRWSIGTSTTTMLTAGSQDVHFFLQVKGRINAL